MLLKDTYEEYLLKTTTIAGGMGDSGTLLKMLAARAENELARAARVSATELAGIIAQLFQRLKMA